MNWCKLNIDNLNIVVIGCSWSIAFKDPEQTADDSHFSWPQYLSYSLKHDYSISANVFNYAQLCNSSLAQLSTFMHVMDWCFYNTRQKIDLVILQYTTENRVSFIDDYNKYHQSLALKNLETPDFPEHMKECNYYQYHVGVDYSHDTNTKNGFKFNSAGILHLTPSMNASTKVKSKFQEAYETYLGYSFQNSLGMDYGHETLRSCVTNYCKSKHISLIEFSQLRFPKKKVFVNQLTKQSSNKIKAQYLLEGIDFVVETKLKNFSKLVIDNGYHFGPAGTKKLVDELIMPRVLPILSKI